MFLLCFITYIESLPMYPSSKFDPRGPLPTDKKYQDRKPLHVLLSRYKVVESGCWEWTGTKNKQGYGVVCIAVNKKPRGIPAPRLQWMHHHGEILPGQVIMHTCDNPPCVNPAHLRCGTQSDNLNDMVAKKRHNPIGIVTWLEQYRRGEVTYTPRGKGKKYVA